MPDWHKTMQQTFEYFTVDPGTWKDVKKLTTVKKCKISRDSEASTLGSATFDVGENLGEQYIRTYLVAVQNGITERFPLGTFLIQTPSTEFDGRAQSVSMDAYTPLLELKENLPPIGYSILKGENVMSIAYRLAREYSRAPVVKTDSDTVLENDFVANTDDTWLTFLNDLTNYAKYSFDLDELGRVIFSPKQELSALRPVWTYNDDNSSILYPEVTVKQDYYGIPNVVEVTYSGDYYTLYGKAVNDDVNSLTSTVNRGRTVTHRATYPSAYGTPTQGMVDNYAKELLKELSVLEYTISYTHGYCPVRVGDCVRLNYTRAGLTNVKAKVISQTLDCSTGCEVTEKAIYTSKLWG